MKIFNSQPILQQRPVEPVRPNRLSVPARDDSGASSFERAVRQGPTVVARPLGYPGGGPGDPAADKLVGLKKGEAKNKDGIKQLQDDLIANGYLDKAVTKNPGYGQTYGDQTAAAVKQFQIDNGLPPTGEIDAATAEALKNPRPHAAPENGYLAGKYRDQLGLPTGSESTLPDGSRKQTFDNGYIVHAADGTTYVCSNTGSMICDPIKPGTVSTAEAGNAYFLNQWGYKDNPYNSGGDRTGNTDCGPTCVAMALEALGVIPNPGPGGAEALIVSMREAALGKGASSKDTGPGDLVTAINANGGHATEHTPVTQADVDNAIASGHPILICSRKTYSTYGSGTAYIEGQKGDPGIHWVAVLGKTANGDYIIADPLAKGGCFVLGKDKLPKLLEENCGSVEVAKA